MPEAHAIDVQADIQDVAVHAQEAQASDHAAADRDGEDQATDAQANDSQDASAHAEAAQGPDHDAAHRDADAPTDDTDEAHEQQLNEAAPAIGLRQQPAASVERLAPRRHSLGQRRY